MLELFLFIFTANIQPFFEIEKKMAKISAKST